VAFGTVRHVDIKLPPRVPMLLHPLHRGRHPYRRGLNVSM